MGSVTLKKMSADASTLQNAICRAQRHGLQSSNAADRVLLASFLKAARAPLVGQGRCALCAAPRVRAALHDGGMCVCVCVCPKCVISPYMA